MGSPSTHKTTLSSIPSPKASLPSPKKSLRNPSNKHWVQEQQRKTFLYHLKLWSLFHDSSPYFHGKISLFPDSQVGSEIGLSKSVACILTDTAFTDARKRIVIRLFPPQKDSTYKRRVSGHTKRHDSMDLFGSDLNFSEWQRAVPDRTKNEGTHEPSLPSNGSANGYYKLVVRCGAGWISAREYFSKIYFTHLEAQKLNPRTYMRNVDQSLTNRSLLLGQPPSEKDSVTVQPLFHPFRRLPSELQEMILTIAAGHTRAYNLCYDSHLVHNSKRKSPSPISLSMMFQISKATNKHLIPYIFHSTDFHFGLTGFTNFLWQAGPANRPEIRRLTFHFGKLALLHCVRWLAPDPVFELLEPPVVTSPRSLQFFWRCQIQDLVRDLDLLTLTINLKGVPPEDIPMVIHILKNAFGSLERLLFVDTDKYGNSKKVEFDDKTKELLGKQSWREMCRGYFERHRIHQYFLKWELLRVESDEFEGLMDDDKEFFVC